VLHDPSREHRGGNFLHPLIEHRVHLLAQVGGVPQTRKLISGCFATQTAGTPTGEYMTTGHDQTPE
jgi:hypothetical protein